MKWFYSSAFCVRAPSATGLPRLNRSGCGPNSPFVKPATPPAFVLPSPETGTAYAIYVHDAPGAAAHPRSVLLFMDGDDQFRYAVDAHRVLTQANASLPPLLLVGVGYGASYTKPGNKRVRDYTPTEMAGEPESGHTDAFLCFLQNTLWPELAQRHAVDPTWRGLAGHSLGSLFALHALFQPEPFFNRFLISSPSVWFDDRSILRLAGRLRDQQDELPARAFLSIGDMDTPSMTGDFHQLEAQLAARPFSGLETVVRHFPKLDHYNVLPAAFREGIAALYA